MENLENDQIENLLNEFKKIEEISGETYDEDYQKMLDDFMNNTFEGMDEDFYKMYKTKTLKVNFRKSNERITLLG